MASMAVQMPAGCSLVVLLPLLLPLSDPRSSSPLPWQTEARGCRHGRPCSLFCAGLGPQVHPVPGGPPHGACRHAKPTCPPAAKLPARAQHRYSSRPLGVQEPIWRRITRPPPWLSSSRRLPGSSMGTAASPGVPNPTPRPPSASEPPPRQPPQCPRPATSPGAPRGKSTPQPRLSSSSPCPPPHSPPSVCQPSLRRPHRLALARQTSATSPGQTLQVQRGRTAILQLARLQQGILKPQVRARPMTGPTNRLRSDLWSLGARAELRALTAPARGSSRPRSGWWSSSRGLGDPDLGPSEGCLPGSPSLGVAVGMRAASSGQSWRPSIARVSHVTYVPALTTDDNVRGSVSHNCQHMKQQDERNELWACHCSQCHVATWTVVPVNRCLSCSSHGRSDEDMFCSIKMRATGAGVMITAVQHSHHPACLPMLAPWVWLVVSWATPM